MIPKYIDIRDRKQLNELLSALQPGTPALWGKLQAQNMIEHLIEAVEYTNGKKIAELIYGPGEAMTQKKMAVYGDFIIPHGVKGHLSDAMQNTRFKDLPTAIEELNKEMNAFENYFAPEGTTAVHQAFGPMDCNEWVIWYGKHFTHHFIQFGLLPTD